MEDEKKVPNGADKELTDQKLDEVSGGKGVGGSYCPYTTDRTCRLGISFDNEDERCLYCGWRAW